MKHRKQLKRLLQLACTTAAIGYGIAATPGWAQTTKDWDGSVNGNYSNANNWTPAGVPATNDQTRYGAISAATGQVNLNATTDIDRILFSGGANSQPFDLRVTSGTTYSITGNSLFNGSTYGVENSSGLTQSFRLNANDSRLNIEGNSQFINNGANSRIDIFNTNGGRIEFTNTGASSSGDANTTIYNANDGFTRFNSGTNAGSLNIRNNASGETYFEDGSSAGGATITNTGGATDFNGGLGAGAGAIITNKANGLTRFNNDAGAGSAIITNNGNNGNIGETRFSGGSSAESAFITNKSDGVTNFREGSNAGLSIDPDPSTHTLIINRSGGQTNFSGNASAGTALIDNNGGQTNFNGGTAGYTNGSTANDAEILNENGGSTNFNGNSHTDGATITNQDGGVTRFTGIATGDSASIIHNKGDNGSGAGVLDISQASNAVTVGEVYGEGNIFLGGTTSGNAGTLITGSSNNDRTISGVIADGGLSLDANGNANPNVDDTGGSLQKEGAGVLRLTNDNTYTGTTTVNNGTLQLDGSITSDTFVNAGGRLTGNGFIGGPDALLANNLTNTDGIISPGHDANSLGNSNPYQSLNVGGTFTAIDNSPGDAAAGAIFEAHVNGNGDHNRLVAGGDINLDGSVRVQTEDQSTGGVYLVNNRYRIVTSTGGFRNGTFADGIDFSNSNILPFLDASLDYNAFSAFLVLTRNSVDFTTGSGLSDNERAAARSLQNNFDPNNTDFVPTYDALLILQSQGNKGFQHGLDIVSGDALTAFPVASQEAALRFNDRIRTRLLNLLANLTTVAAVPSARMAYTGTHYKALLAANPTATASAQANDAARDDEIRRSNIWATIAAARENADSDGNGPGFDARATEYQVGYDRAVGGNTVVGISVGKSDGRLDVDNRDANGDFDTTSIGLYASHDSGARDAVFWNGELSYHHHSISSTRDLLAGGDANADYHGHTIGLQGEVGKRFGKGSYSIEPSLTVKLNNTHQDGFEEDGGPGALRVDGSSYNTRRVGFGVRFVNRKANVRIRPHLFLGYEHEFGDTQSELTNELIGLGSNFNVQGTDLGKNIWTAKLGADARLNDRFSLVGEIGASWRKNQNARYLYGGVKYGF